MSPKSVHNILSYPAYIYTEKPTLPFKR